MPINIPDGVTGSYELPTIELEPINARHLDEVEVFATKLKFYHKGDTLVYNAAAFMLSNGSMLEELVRQLPGVELKEGGRILSEGRIVESLLINGKDLFNGKTEIALQNLAAYTVDNIKVYNKAGHLSQMIGVDAGDMKLVMDVKLKREFSHGWIGNLQGGYGSDNRYMAKLFDMLFTSDVALTAHFSNNNLSDGYAPSRDDNLWSSGQMGIGHERHIRGGATYYAEGNDNNWLAKGEVNVKRTSTASTSNSVTEYFERSAKYGYNNTVNSRKNYEISTFHEVFAQVSDRINITVNPSFEFGHNSGTTDFVSALLAESVPELTPERIVGMLTAPANDTVLNSTLKESAYRGHHLLGVADIKANYLLSRGDVVRLLIFKTYFRHSQDDGERFSRFYNRELNATDSMYRNFTATGPNTETTIIANLTFQQHLHWGSLPITYSFRHTRRHDDQTVRRVPFGDPADIFTGNGLMLLPEASAMTMLPMLSPESRQTVTTHNISIQPTHTHYLKIGKFWAYFKPIIVVGHQSGTLHQRIGDQEINPKRNDITFTGQLKATWGRSTGWTHHAEITYENGPVNIADLRIRVFENSLYTFKPNLDLRNMNETKFNYHAKKNRRGISQLFQIDGTYCSNTVSSSIQTDENTGGYIYTMRNDKYRLKANTFYNFEASFGPDRCFWVNTRPSATMDRYEFYDGKTHSSYETKLSADFRWSNDRFNLSAHASGTKTWYKQQTLRFNTLSGSVGASGLVKLPMGWNVRSNINLTSRSGFITDELNRARWIWNATVSKSLCRGKLIVAAEGYDLLNQRDSFSAYAYEWGRVMTQTGLISRYVLVHAIYRFNVNPKNTKEPGSRSNPTEIMVD